MGGTGIRLQACLNLTGFEHHAPGSLHHWAHNSPSSGTVGAVTLLADSLVPSPGSSFSLSEGPSYPNGVGPGPQLWTWSQARILPLLLALQEPLHTADGTGACSDPTLPRPSTPQSASLGSLFLPSTILRTEGI